VLAHQRRGPFICATEAAKHVGSVSRVSSGDQTLERRPRRTFDRSECGQIYSFAPPGNRADAPRTGQAPGQVPFHIWLWYFVLRHYMEAASARFRAPGQHVAGMDRARCATARSDPSQRIPEALTAGRPVGRRVFEVLITGGDWLMLPNFIVIGAAKAGTTSLHWYLTEHPEVFVTPAKDPSFFAYNVDADGRLLWGEPEFHSFPVRSLDEYERLFADTGDAKAVGEVSTMYLECPQSAARISKLLPAARIVCSIRQPVDRAYSDYVMYLRHRGRRFDPARDLTATSDWAQPDSRWMRIGRYHEQLSRYYEAFPQDQIRVVLFDDLKRDPTRYAQGVYGFLAVEAQFMPDVGTPHAPGGLPASPMLERFFRQGSRSAVRPLVPKSAANWLRRLRTRTFRPIHPLPKELRKMLTGHFKEDIAKTSELIGRSLDHWL